MGRKGLPGILQEEEEEEEEEKIETIATWDWRGRGHWARWG